MAPETATFAMKRIVYVSRSTLPSLSADAEVRSLVESARSKNATLGITGALIFTGDHFAQIIEGPDAQIDGLMAQVLHDPRHHSIQHFEDLDVPGRHFATWSLAYQGPSTFVDRRVRSLFVSDAAVRPRLKSELLDLLHDFVTP
jgi:hypothetical protein